MELITAAGAVATIATLVVTLGSGGGGGGALPRDQPTGSSASGEPSLSVADAAVTHSAWINAVDQGPGGSEASKVQQSVVDITLRNTGQQPALVDYVRVTILGAAQIGNCAGAGPGVVTANYLVRIPTSLPPKRLPLTVVRPLRFVVNSDSIDRFTISLGPRTTSATD